MHVSLSLAGVGFALAALMGCGHAGSEMALPDLQAYLGKSRVLILEAPSVDTLAYRQSSEALAAVTAELRDRDLIVITQLGAPAYRVRLVGKDGGVKAESQEALDPVRLFALIDAMPMRQAELAGRKTRDRSSQPVEGGDNDKEIKR